MLIKRITKLLIDNGADLNEKANCGYTPLHAADLNRDTEMKKLLIDSGADINIKEDTYPPDISKNTKARINTKMCFSLAVVLSALIITAAFLTQTYVILAALVIPAIIGLHGWSLYKEDQNIKPDSKLQENIEVTQPTITGVKAGA